tara:strand:+ start:975 stop:1436 length:462 start_codon:yes stop_codon:yes gene_type:complete
MKMKLQKSPQAFRTISEVSQELNLPNHVLRFWETKFSQVQPLKRSGGRRYYRPKDIKLLFKIKNLLYNNGYTLKGVKKILSQNNALIIENNPSNEVVENIGTDDSNENNIIDKDQILFNFHDDKDKNIPPIKKIKEELLDIITDIDNLISKIN